jgi:hypothetical protein
MEQTTLFIFGGAISLVVFTGLFTYVMYSFKDWSERNSPDGTASRSDPIAK